MSTSSTEAFNTASGAAHAANQLSTMIPALIFGLLFLFFAYVGIKLYEEWAEGKLPARKFIKIMIRYILLIVIMGLFLL